MPHASNPRPLLPNDARRDAERLHVDASLTREKAVREAEQMIARAAAVAREIEEESRAEAEAVTAAARAEAHRLVSEAWRHVDALVRHTEELVAALGPLQPVVDQVRALRASASVGLPPTARPPRPEGRQYGA